MQTAPHSENPWLNGLNPAQRVAVQTLSGPVLVLSGAGTGKTRVLTSRLAELVATGTAKPWNILAVTFTNKAAREMQERVREVVPMAKAAMSGSSVFRESPLVFRHRLISERMAYGSGFFDLSEMWLSKRRTTPKGSVWS